MSGFSWDEPPTTFEIECPRCGFRHPSSIGFVLLDGNACAISRLEWHPTERLGLLEVTLGSFNEPDYPDNVTFAVMIGPVVAGPADITMGLIQSLGNPGNPVYGARPTRDEALRHPWIRDLWRVVDWLATEEPLMAHHVSHAG